MTEGYYFSIKSDNELIAAGTRFWCQACVVARPLVEQSPDPRYCLSCFDVLKAEKEMQPTSKAAWMPKVADSNRKATVKPPDGQGGVAKVIQPVTPPITGKKVIMKQRGRPRKDEGEVSRVTKWRRTKEGIQGVLV